MAPSIIYLPTMALTMVRRVTAKLPYNHFLFRCVREQRRGAYTTCEEPGLAV